MDPFDLRLTPVDILAYRLRIEHAKDVMALNDTLQQIVTLGAFPTELVPSVIESLQNGNHILAEILCTIIISTNSQDLFQFAQSKRLLFDWEHVRLFENGFPLEDILCARLYKCFEDNENYLRSLIVNAMAKRGGKASLDLLSVIEYELSDFPNVLKAKEDIVEALMLKSFRAFVESVKKAKESIQIRIENPEAEGGGPLS